MQAKHITNHTYANQIQTDKNTCLKHSHMHSQAHEHTHVHSYMCAPTLTHAHLISMKEKVLFFCGHCLEHV